MSLLERFQAGARPSTFNPASGTFVAVLATNVPLDRGSFIETLDLDAIAAVGWPESLPLQADHRREVAQTIGRLANLRLETIANGVRALVADGTLTRGPHTAAVAANLEAGHQRGVSISLDGLKVVEGKDPATGKRTRKVVAGRLVEASFVVDPADPLSIVRSTDMSATATDTTTTTTPPATPPTTPATRAGLSPEAFESLARMAGFPDEAIAVVRNADASDEVKFQMLQRASASTQPVIRTAGGHNDSSLDNPTVLRSAAVEAFDTINRGEEPKGAAAAVFADGEAAFARRLLRSAGHDVRGLSDLIVLRNAAATSDYAIIAGSTFNLSMRRELNGAASPITALLGRMTVVSFNPETSGLVDWTTLAIGDKLENGEYKRSYVDESGELVEVHTIGGVTSITRELSINAGARLGNMGQKFAKRLSADIADRTVRFLEQGNAGGPKMPDGKRVFDASRGNIATLRPIEGSYEGEIMSIRGAMPRRKGAGNVMIGEYPTHWVVHSDFEETALRIVSAVQPSSIADVNTLAGKLQVVVEPRLTDPAKSWLAVEPAKMDGAVRVYLQGHEAPFTESRNAFETDTIDFKIRQDFGLGWLEWRSWTRLDHVIP